MLKKQPVLTIIIPTYNRVHTLKRAIKSVLSQTYPNIELIIVDDGSTDGTDNLIKNLPLKYYYQTNKGVSAARNKGIKESKGEYIAFLDSDDEWKPEKLEQQIKFFEQNPDYKICQTQEIWIRNGKFANPKKKHAKPEGWIFEPSLKLCLVSPSAVIIHKTIFDDIGMFDETLPACEDYDLWLRISLHYPVGLVDEKLVIKYGGHDDQLSRNWGLDKHRIQSLKKILDTETLTKEQKEKTIAVLQSKTAIYEQGRKKHK